MDRTTMREWIRLFLYLLALVVALAGLTVLLLTGPGR